MEFKILTNNQIPLANSLLASTEYYDTVDLSEIGGLVLGCMRAEKLVAVAWLLPAGRRAYLDYLAVDPDHKGVGPRMLIVARSLLQDMGINEVLFQIHGSNTEAGRMAEVFGAALDGPYIVGTAQIGEPNG